MICPPSSSNPPAMYSFPSMQCSRWLWHEGGGLPTVFTRVQCISSLLLTSSSYRSFLTKLSCPAWR